MPFFFLHVMQCPGRRRRRKQCRRRRPLGIGTYVDVRLQNASICSPLCLDRVTIPVEKCRPDLQHNLRQFKRLKRCSQWQPRMRTTFFSLLPLLLLGLVCPVAATTTSAIVGGAYGVTRCFLAGDDRYYMLPGTGYAIDTAPDTASSPYAQRRATRSIVHHLSAANPATCFAGDTTVNARATIPTMPYCFIADTDSFTIAIDSGANCVIVNDKRLLTKFRRSNQQVSGLQGRPINAGGEGKLRMRLRSVDGHVEEIDHPAIFCPTSPYNLAPPQLLVRALKRRGYVHSKGYHDDNEYIIQFSRSHAMRHQIRIPISPNDLFLLQMNDGYTSFFSDASRYDANWQSFAGTTYVNEFNHSIDMPNETDTTGEEPRQTFANKSILVENDEDEEDLVTQESGQQLTVPSDAGGPTTIEYDEHADFEPIPHLPHKFEISEGDMRTSEGEDPKISRIRHRQMRLATYHEKLGHVSFDILKRLSLAGLIPKDLANVPPPRCPGCQYGKAHRKPWRAKGWRMNNRNIKRANCPGAVVSIDQLVSPTPGFVPTHRGRPTTMRYLGATVFCDHFSDLTYVHLMTKLDAESTVKAKEAFERVAADSGVNVLHYHADNGLFDTKAFKRSVQVSGQTLSFCGVNAHHQNGVAERRIKDVTEGARTALLHAAHRWPKAVHASLWPCAIKHYVNLRNSLLRKFTPKQQAGSQSSQAKFEDSPISRFSGTVVEPNLNHFHPFGSPVYVLEAALQSGMAHNKWTDRARVGIFLCHSPHHATDVPLILNTQTGLVSPQFHLIYDDDFDTVKRDAKFRSLWQIKVKIQTHQQGHTSHDVLPMFSDRSAQRLPTAPADPTVQDMFQVPWANAE